MWNCSFQSTLSSSQRQCDSVLQEINPPHVDDYEECQQESGSPCMSGGLHIPTSRSMREFARRVHQQHRQRFYSQCTLDTKGSGLSDFSAGSSPGEGSALFHQAHVRRANSYPEMKKSPVLPGADANIGKSLDEREELEASEGILINLGGNKHLYTVNGSEDKIAKMSHDSKKQMSTASTQTVDHWSPLPYEHLFLGAFPPVEHAQNQNGDVKPSVEPSPIQVFHHNELFTRCSPYDMLDMYIETAVQGHARDDKDAKKSKIQGEFLYTFASAWFYNSVKFLI